MNNMPLLRRLALIASIVIVTLVAAGLSAGARNMIARGDRTSTTRPAPSFSAEATSLASK